MESDNENVKKEYLLKTFDNMFDEVNIKEINEKFFFINLIDSIKKEKTYKKNIENNSNDNIKEDYLEQLATADRLEFYREKFNIKKIYVGKKEYINILIIELLDFNIILIEDVKEYGFNIDDNDILVNATYIMENPGNKDVYISKIEEIEKNEKELGLSFNENSNIGIKKISHNSKKFYENISNRLKEMVFELNQNDIKRNDIIKKDKVDKENKKREKIIYINEKLKNCLANEIIEEMVQRKFEYEFLDDINILEKIRKKIIQNKEEDIKNNKIKKSKKNKTENEIEAEIETKTYNCLIYILINYAYIFDDCRLDDNQKELIIEESIKAKDITQYLKQNQITTITDLENKTRRYLDEAQYLEEKDYIKLKKINNINIKSLEIKKEKDSTKKYEKYLEKQEKAITTLKKVFPNI